MTPIEDAVKVGPVLAAELRAAGVDSLERLRELGYLEAWRRIHAVNPDRDCTHSCLALAGAIEGRRWMRMPKPWRERVAAEARAAG